MIIYNLGYRKHIQWRTERGVGEGSNPEIPKALQNRAKLNPIVKNFKNCWIQDANTRRCSGKKGSKILKLPPVRNCFTLAMTNKLVVNINSLKVPKIKKHFTVWNKISCTKLQLPPEPLTRGLPPPDPLSLCPQLNLLNPPSEQNSWVRHWTQYGVS